MAVIPLADFLSREGSGPKSGGGRNGDDNGPQVQGVVIYGALTGALVLLFLIFVLVLFLQRRRQRAHLRQLRQEEEARRRRRRRRRRAGLRTTELDEVAPEMIVGAEWESTSDEGAEAGTGEVSTVAKLGSVEEGGRKRTVVELDKEVVCAVCLEELSGGEVVRKLPCEHIFHSVCIHRWAKRANKCPCCLQRIVHRKRKKSELGEDGVCEDDGTTAEGATEEQSDPRGESAIGESASETTQRGSSIMEGGGLQSNESTIEIQSPDSLHHVTPSVQSNSRMTDAGDDETSLVSFAMDRSDAARMLDEVRQELGDPAAHSFPGEYSGILDEYSAQLNIPAPPPVAGALHL